MEDRSESSINQYDRLAEVIADKVFHGRLPNCPGVIVQGVLNVVASDLPEVPETVMEAAKQYFAECLLLALRDRIAAQDAAERPFQN
jgi:hypothetical protein